MQMRKLGSEIGKKKERRVIDRSIRGSLVVDIDGDRDSFSASLEPVERGFLVSDDEGNIG